MPFCVGQLGGKNGVSTRSHGPCPRASKVVKRSLVTGSSKERIGLWEEARTSGAAGGGLAYPVASALQTQVGLVFRVP